MADGISAGALGQVHRGLPVRHHADPAPAGPQPDEGAAGNPGRAEAGGAAGPRGAGEGLAKETGAEHAGPAYAGFQREHI